MLKYLEEVVIRLVIEIKNLFLSFGVYLYVIVVCCRYRN